MKKLVFAVILLIEDSTVTRKTIKESLKNFNLGFLESATGMAGLVMAQHALPDIILLDLNLPDMHGYDVLQEIRKNPVTSKIPVIIITQSNLTQDVQKSLKGGAQYYLIKPLDTSKLLAAICKLLDVEEDALTQSSINHEKIMADIKKKLEFGQPQENKTPTSYNKVDLQNVKPGMVLALPVTVTGGRTLLNIDTVLNEERIQEMKANDVKYVFVKPTNQ